MPNSQMNLFYVTWVSTRPANNHLLNRDHVHVGLQVVAELPVVGQHSVQATSFRSE